jgi:hypothetical protein
MYYTVVLLDSSAYFLPNGFYFMFSQKLGEQWFDSEYTNILQFDLRFC